MLIYHERLERIAYGRSFVMSDLSDSLTVTNLSWANWAICSQSLICLERSERIAHSHSFELSEMSEWANSQPWLYPIVCVGGGMLDLINTSAISLSLSFTLCLSPLFLSLSISLSLSVYRRVRELPACVSHIKYQTGRFPMEFGRLGMSERRIRFLPKLRSNQILEQHFKFHFKYEKTLFKIKINCTPTLKILR